MAYISVYVNIGDFDTDDILDELIARIKDLDKDDIKKLRKAIGSHPLPAVKKQSLNDMLLEELFKEAAEKYSLAELQKRLA